MTLLEWTKDLLKGGVELFADEKEIQSKNGAVLNRDCRKLREVSLGVISTSNAEEWYRICRLNCPVGTVIEPYIPSVWEDLYNDTTALVRNALTKSLVDERSAKSASTLLSILSRRDKEHWAEDKGKSFTAEAKDTDGKSINLTFSVKD